MLFAKRKQKKEARLVEEKADILENVKLYTLTKGEGATAVLSPPHSIVTLSPLPYESWETLAYWFSQLLLRFLELLSQDCCVIVELIPSHASIGRTKEEYFEYQKRYQAAFPAQARQLPGRYEATPVYLFEHLPVEWLDAYLTGTDTSVLCLDIRIYTETYLSMMRRNDEELQTLFNDGTTEILRVSTCEDSKYTIHFDPKKMSLEDIVAGMQQTANQLDLRLEVQ